MTDDDDLERVYNEGVKAAIAAYARKTGKTFQGASPKTGFGVRQIQPGDFIFGVNTKVPILHQWDEIESGWRCWMCDKKSKRLVPPAGGCVDNLEDLEVMIRRASRY